MERVKGGFEPGGAAARMLPASARVLLVTSAYHMARAKKEFEQAGLGVGPGDEVIGSTLTFVGSISPVIFLGASVVLVDCDRATWNMDPDLLARELEQAGERGKLPKAVVPTDLYGQCADYGRANRWLSVILITPEQFGADREAVRLALEAENIESRPVWKPMHLQPVFQTTHPCRVVGGSVSQDLFTRGLCLPSGTAMNEEDQNRVVDAILGCRK